AGVRDAVRPLADLARRTGKPVLFTEAGYPWTRAPWIAPRVADARRPAGGEDSSRAVAAVYRALGGASWGEGADLWETFSDGQPAAANERGYNVIGTPAEKTIADGFRRKSAS